MSEEELLQELVEIYSPSGRESLVARRLHSWLSSKDTFDEVVIDDVGNVVARKGPEPHLLLCGHMDTVPGRLKVRVREGELSGRGAVDAKGPLVAMAAAAAQCAQSGLNSISFAGVVGEERDGRGIKHLISMGNRFLGGVFGEPTHGSKIVVSYKGRLGVSLTARGVASHSASPAKDLNAIESAMSGALELRRDLHQLGCTTVLTKIKGGLADNVTPPDCTIWVDIRVPTDCSTEEVEAAIRERSLERVQVSIYDKIPPVNVGRTNIVFNAAAGAIREVGGEPTAVAKMGTSDMNLFYASYGVPCVALGPGDPSLSHTNAERIQLEDFRRSIDVYSRIILNLSAVKPHIPFLAP